MRREVAQTIRSALCAYEAETLRYLGSYGSYDPEHDICCDRHRARQEARQEEERLLRQRAQNINDALALFGPSLDLREGPDVTP